MTWKTAQRKLCVVRESHIGRKRVPKPKLPQMTLEAPAMPIENYYLLFKSSKFNYF